MGGALLATTLRLDGQAVVARDEATALLHGALAIPAVTAAQLAVVAPEVLAVPFSIAGENPDYPDEVVLVLEGYDRDALDAASGAVTARLELTPLGRSPMA